ncbi:hypothetical protein BDA96_05G197400 [Sorghum bicolor]|jgi:hypothetical protein|uniref:Uncharacterized protein n=1 Tax=Sorghum bicolor TaxID=4558 RepID=A0A921UG97_SORBI|nr:hypothetical protein BDA96_05G197400 [Sorghum bicolor]
MAAGGEGSARWRTANSLEAAATLRRCSTKRKSGKEEASGRMPRRRKEKETASAASACADAEKSAAGAAKNRLPAKDIRWILAQKPEAPPPIYQALKRSNPELVPRPEEEGAGREAACAVRPGQGVLRGGGEATQVSAVGAQ